MKKVLSVLMASLMLFASVGCLMSAYAADYCDVYGHRYSDWTATQVSSCRVVGLETRLCEFCNDIQTRTTGLNPDNHISTVLVKTNNDGTHVLKCVDCDEVLDRNCTYSAWTNNGNGTDSRTCYYCRYTQTAPCDFSSCVPNDETPGTHLDICAQCGATRVETCSFTAEKTVAASCTASGYTALKCDCGNIQVTGVIAALGHIDENGDEICERCSASLAAPTEPTEAPTEDEPQKQSFIDTLKAFFRKIIDWLKNIFA